jgi:hypothetical protein
MRRALIQGVVLLATLIAVTGCSSSERCGNVGASRAFSALQVPRPTPDDAERARHLDPEVLDAVRQYFTIEPGGCLPPAAGSNPVIAARDHGRYLLLDVTGCAADGNRHLVYSKELHCIVSTFAWYMQG